MKFKKYVVNSMNEAMSLIKAELGKDAIIVSHRKVKTPGIKGFFGHKMLEVTATSNDRPTRTNIEPQRNDEELNNSIEAIKNLLNNKINVNEAEKEVAAEVETVSSSGYEELIKEVKEMKKMVSSLGDKSEKKEESELHKLLKEKDVLEEYINEIEEYSSGSEENEEKIEKVKEYLVSEIKVSQNKLSNVIVFVGPTGVGKTTTIAKLAGKLALHDNKKVGLITVDTYRIGAVEQLRTYAEIMNVPFEIVFSMKEMEESIQKMSQCDIILVDTTGRSSKNMMQLSELRAFVEKTKSNCIHLVVSATTKNKDLSNIINAYKQFKYNNIIITKLDETSSFGAILNISKMAREPISYITTGQNVPDDLMEASTELLTRFILQED